MESKSCETERAERWVTTDKDKIIYDVHPTFNVPISRIKLIK